MKKLLSVLLAVTLILCAAPMALATEDSSVHMHSVSTDCSASEG